MILLPLLAVLVWSLACHRHGGDWLEAMVGGLLAFGLTASLASEAQSLLGVLTPAGSAGAWLAASGLGLAVARRGTAPAVAPARPGRLAAQLAPVIVLLTLTGVVALLSAPNSYDGLSYHLIRPERWIEQGSLRPFATHDTRQLFMPSWPEYVMLQFRLLSGGDRFANLVQWIGYVASIGGGALLARALGGQGPASSIGAALVATLPMAVSQASGTQTDVAAAGWTVVAVAYGYRLLSPPARARDGFFSAAGLGLAAATKQTALLFAGMALVPVLILAGRRAGWRRWAQWVIACAALFALTAGPQLYRNWQVFGSWQGDANVVLVLKATERGPGAVLSTALRNLSVHFGTPWDRVNQAVAAGVAATSRAVGTDPSDPRTTWLPPFTAVPWTTHEELASNPLHLLLILGCAIVVLGSRKRPTLSMFVASLGVGFVTYSALFKWQLYEGRLQTPLFVLGLGLVAVVLERVNVVARWVLLGALLLVALPNALCNYTRPLIAFRPMAPRPALLSVPRNLRYFLYMPNLGYGYFDVARRIVESDCPDVGVRAWPDAWEYPVLALARSGGSEARFRSVDVTNPSARFEDHTRPCLLLLIGPQRGQLPGWAQGWTQVADWYGQLGSRGVALYTPPH